MTTQPMMSPLLAIKRVMKKAIKRAMMKVLMAVQTAVILERKKMMYHTQCCLSDSRSQDTRRLCRDRMACGWTVPFKMIPKPSNVT